VVKELKVALGDKVSEGSLVLLLGPLPRSRPRTPAGGGVTGGGELNLIPWPKVDFAKFGPVERKELSRIKKISGANLLRNAMMIPAVTNHDDADITDLEAFRVATNKENEKAASRSPCWPS
jgi:pyruvate/2-oxoglutarate dehydrogenase complex dihydrolipoamide acyltransferase (E2) component